MLKQYNNIIFNPKMPFYHVGIATKVESKCCTIKGINEPNTNKQY